MIRALLAPELEGVLATFFRAACFGLAVSLVEEWDLQGAAHLDFDLGGAERCELPISDVTDAHQERRNVESYEHEVEQIHFEAEYWQPVAVADVRAVGFDGQEVLDVLVLPVFAHANYKLLWIWNSPCPAGVLSGTSPNPNTSPIHNPAVSKIPS